MPVNSTVYGIQRIFHMRGYYIAGDNANQLAVELRNNKETTFTNDQTTVYLTGDRANAEQLSFDHSKRVMITGSSATISDGLVKVQIGDEVETTNSSTAVSLREIVEVSSDTANTQFTATGTANEEIGFVYQLNADGTAGTVFTQAASVAANMFTYTSGTKTITFNSGDVADGTRFEVIYKPTLSSVKSVTNFTTQFSETLRWEMDALLKDQNDQEIMGQIQIPKGKIMGSFEWTLAADGDPAVHGFEIHALQDFATEKLWDMYIFDDADFS